MQLRSITAKSSVVIVATTFCILGALGCIDYVVSGRALRAERVGRLTSCMNRLAVTVAPHLWNYDREKTSELVQLEMNNEDIESAVIFNRDSTVFSGICYGADTLRPVNSEDSLLLSDTQGEVHVLPIRASEEVIGYIRLVCTPKELDRHLRKLILFNVLRMCVVSLLLFITISFLLHRMVIRPISVTIGEIKEITDANDLTRSVSMRSNDEIGDLCTALNQFFSAIHTLISRFDEKIKVLSRASSELHQVADALSEHTDDIKKRTGNVVASVSEASMTTESVARGAGSLSNNVQSVTVSIEQLSAAAKKINEQCQHESEIAADAQGRSAAMRESMDRLGDAARQITTITGVIEGIAAQTNLLALNAAIEAASAGDAGKGFAVVASEVKQLAMQTTSATGEISRRIEEVQSIVMESVESAESIGSVITDVNTISQAIVSAVELQGASIGKIAGSLSSADSASDSIAADVMSSSEGMKDISLNINGIDTGIRDIARQGMLTKQYSENLSSITSDIKKLTDAFTV